MSNEFDSLYSLISHRYVVCSSNIMPDFKKSNFHLTCAMNLQWWLWFDCGWSSWKHFASPLSWSSYAKDCKLPDLTIWITLDVLKLDIWLYNISLSQRSNAWIVLVSPTLWTNILCVRNTWPFMVKNFRNLFYLCWKYVQ